MIGCLLWHICQIDQLPPSQVERAAETRVAREQKRAAELEEAARCIYNFDHRLRSSHELTIDHGIMLRSVKLIMEIMTIQRVVRGQLERAQQGLEAAARLVSVWLGFFVKLLSGSVTSWM